MSGEERFTLVVDGVEHEVVDAPQDANLVAVMRHRLGLMAAKDACQEGSCGSCAVLLDGAMANACTVLAADAVGAQVTTAAGFGTPDAPSDVQEALVRAGAVQCGFCTPGMVVAIEHLLASTPQPDEAAVRMGLSGNLCRCTGYGRIVDAVLQVAAARAAS